MGLMVPRVGAAKRPLSLLSLVVLAATIVACAPTAPPLPPAPAVVAEPIQPLSFPRDDGPHEMLTEWWYYTGHLATSDGARFGFEYVVFQAVRGATPPAYVAHFAVTDHARQSFRYDQRYQPVTEIYPGERFDLRVEDWLMRGAGGTDHLSARTDDYALTLETHSLKPPVQHDGDGYISFGVAGGSYYYSRTRLEATGTLVDHGVPREVTGEVWFDHQWGNFLVVGGGGWDWYSAHLDDGSELTVSVVRDGQADVGLAYGTYVRPNGEVIHLPADAFTATPLDTWTSPHSGATYPSGWRIEVRDPALSLRMIPVVQDQELDARETTGAIYWEGEVVVDGSGPNGALSGLGYVELTGYAD